MAITDGQLLSTVCVYNTAERTQDTLGGLGSMEEMCLHAMLTYPENCCAILLSLALDLSTVFMCSCVQYVCGWYEMCLSVQGSNHVDWTAAMVTALCSSSAAIRVSNNSSWLVACCCYQSGHLTTPCCGNLCCIAVTCWCSLDGVMCRSLNSVRLATLVKQVCRFLASSCLCTCMPVNYVRAYTTPGISPTTWA